MKKKSIMICTLLIACLMLSILGCGKKEEPTLSGSYTSPGHLNQMNYTFDGENGVTVRFLVGGFSVSSQTGTYVLNKDGSVITFSFPAGDESVELPDGMTSLGGAFSFKQEEDCIWIGTVCYQKDAVGAESEESVQPDAEPIALEQIHLTLPEQYAISYEVTEESSGVSRTYTQAIVSTDAGIFLDLGDSNEKYVFEKLNSGKYTEYRYNSLTGKYETPLISAVDSNVVSGYTARVTTCFDFYEEFRGYMTYQGQETIEAVNCQKYVASYNTATGKKTVELWIDPQTGLCIKGIYQHKSAVGVTGAKTIQCTQMKTEGVALPIYR